MYCAGVPLGATLKDITPLQELYIMLSRELYIEEAVKNKGIYAFI